MSGTATPSNSWITPDGASHEVPLHQHALMANMLAVEYEAWSKCPIRSLLEHGAVRTQWESRRRVNVAFRDPTPQARKAVRDFIEDRLCAGVEVMLETPAGADFFTPGDRASFRQVRHLVEEKV